MPDITLEEIDPRIALASIVASIALQEAAVSHVLNAEGEKIQAVVGMTGTTVEELQDINQSVMDTVNNVALYEDDLRVKLRSALEALFPTATFPIAFIDSVTGELVDCQCAWCTLTNNATGDSSTIYARGNTLTLTGLKPGSYTLHMMDACAGYAYNEGYFDIYVDTSGNVTFNGAMVTDESPAVIELNEAPSGAAAHEILPVMEPQPTQEALPEPAPEPQPAHEILPELVIEPQHAQEDGYYVLRIKLPGLDETPEAQ